MRGAEGQLEWADQVPIWSANKNASPYYESYALGHFIACVAGHQVKAVCS